MTEFLTWISFSFQIFSTVEIVRGRRFALWWSSGTFQEKANKQWYRFVQTLHWSTWEKGRQNRRWTRKGTHFFNTILIKFSFSEKATKNCAICYLVLTFTKQMSKPLGRLSKFVWPSQKSWTLSTGCLTKRIRGALWSSIRSR